jgi:hypothetical protein
MNLLEFKSFLDQYDCFCSKLGDRESNVIFNISICTYIDEVNQKRHMKMNFFEFWEALGRVAEKLSLSAQDVFN